MAHSVCGSNCLAFSGSQIPAGSPPLAGNPSVIPPPVPEFLLELHPSAGNPSRIPAECVSASDRFRKQMTETLFFR